MHEHKLEHGKFQWNIRIFLLPCQWLHLGELNDSGGGQDSKGRGLE